MNAVKLKLQQLLLPVGLLALCLPLLVTHYTTMPAFADGFLKGLGITFIFASLLKGKLSRRKNN